MYEKFIEKYFSSKLLSQFEANSFGEYNQAILDKQNQILKWESFKKIIQELLLTTSIRDFTQSSHPHCNKLAIGINGLTKGIVFNQSHLPKMVGFYYFDYSSDAIIPINSLNGLNKNMSYYPFNHEQEDAAKIILEISTSIFDGYELFNNFFAATKYKDVIVDLTIQEEIDCFQIFFDHNIIGLV
jgi:hypothetical protein